MSPQPRRILIVPVALACAAALVLAGCHGSSKKPKVSATTVVPSTDAKGQPRVSLALKLGTLGVESTDVAKKFDPAIAQKILKLVDDYLATAEARPLFTGSVSTGLVRFFAPALAARVGVKGHDRAALTDERVPVMTDVSGTTKQPLQLVGLQQNGRLLMVGARFGITVKGTTAQGPLAISRLGNLVFEPDANHVWHITGYNLIVRRDTGTSSTTQKATTTTAAK